MSIYHATKNLAKGLKPLIARLELEPFENFSQDDMNSMMANSIANLVMQVAYQAAQEVKEQIKDSIIKAMEDY